MEYSNVYPATSVNEEELSAWDWEALPNWDEIRGLALEDVNSANSDPDGTQLGALTTAYVFHDVGCRRWLEALMSRRERTR